MGQYSSTLATEANASEKKTKHPSHETLGLDDEEQNHLKSKHNNCIGPVFDNPSDSDPVRRTEQPQDIASNEYYNKSLFSIVDLSNEEIQSRLNRLNLSAEIFLLAHKQAVLSQFDDSFCWYHDGSSVNQHHESSSRQAADVDQLHMNIALYILSLSPTVRNIRFKLVPSRLSENKFWRIMFSFICHGTDGHWKKSKDDVDISKNGDDSLNSTDCSFESTIQMLRTKIQKQEEEIHQLLMTVTELKNGKLQYSNQMEYPHRGKWIIDKESIEFLNLDEEIKETLREGKLKRIQEVHEQMKFILDSDKVEDTRGKWDCCGEIHYKSQCLCETKNVDTVT